VNGLDRINTADRDAVRQSLLACCDIPSWADAVVGGRPYADEDALLAVADEAARRFTPSEVERALEAHPRIGERATGAGAGQAWSRQEQAGVSEDDALQQELVEGNRAYEERFGRVFLICATGKSGEQILSSLRERLGNDTRTEARVVADELRQIALVRLRKLVNEEGSVA
jgi:2-oxo-4-hydroxy-4-carboxy-5-ureidoimidazoline decarboxylase